MPIVTTTTGVEGIDAITGEHLLVADEPAQFADAVVRVLKNPNAGATLARNGRRLVEEKYDWQVALPKLQAVYQSLCGA
jgi:glycosyltransferase involved in cell wall biosynthesis